VAFIVAGDGLYFGNGYDLICGLLTLIMRVAIKTLGCKSNRYESDKLFEVLSFEHEVFEMNEGVNSFQRKVCEEADILIVNSCTVTHVADRKSRQAVRSFKSANPLCKVVVFGCGVVVTPKDYEGMEEVDFVARNAEEVVQFVEELQESSKNEDKIGDSGYEYGLRTRAVIKIQDGCNNYCTYCIIPRARGGEISFDKDKVLKEVKHKECEGFKEIVLTGIIISNWEQDDMDLWDLVEYLIKNTDEIRFRISSLEPQNFSEKIFDLFNTGRLCPHIHMSLQSGSDDVLKRMRRRYDTKLFLEICEKLRDKVPDIGLTTDVIVGFPGETDEDFEKTCEFVKKIVFLKTHVFPYSKRKNTAAYYMNNQIPEDVKKERAKKLRKISNELGCRFKKAFLGKEYEVIVETCEDGICTGFTPNYIPVQFSCTYCVGDVVTVKLKSVDDNCSVEAISV